MIAYLPAPDLAAEQRLAEAHRLHELAGQEVVRLEQAAAARIAQKTFGTGTEKLIFEKDKDLDGDTAVTLLRVLGKNNELLWFNEEVACARPAAMGISDDRPTVQIHSSVRSAIELHLADAYDAAGGVSAAMKVSDDRDLKERSTAVNLLELNVPMALQDTSPRAASAQPIAVMRLSADEVVLETTPSDPPNGFRDLLGDHHSSLHVTVNRDGVWILALSHAEDPEYVRAWTPRHLRTDHDDD